MANRLSILLKEKGIKQDQLAIELGIPSATISRWCGNKSQPSDKILFRISKELNVEMDDLIYTKTKVLYLSKEKPLILKSFNCDDLFIYNVFGKEKLSEIDSAIIKFTIKSNLETYSKPIILISSIKQNPNIPVIEVNRVFFHCKMTTLTLENCDIEIALKIGYY